MDALYPFVLNSSHVGVTCTNTNNESCDYELNTIAGHPIKKDWIFIFKIKKGTQNCSKKSIKLKNWINKQIINYKMNIVNGIMKLTLNRWISDLRWERWSWKESNWALQVLHVKVEPETTTFWTIWSTWFEGGWRVWEWGEGRKWQESKKFGGSWKIERWSFSWDDAIVCCNGRVSD